MGQHDQGSVFRFRATDIPLTLRLSALDMGQGATMNLDRLTPVEQVARRRRRIGYLLVAVVAVLLFYYLIFVQSYVVAYTDDEQHLAHGSIGSEISIPWWNRPRLTSWNPGLI